MNIPACGRQASACRCHIYYFGTSSLSGSWDFGSMCYLIRPHSLSMWHCVRPLRTLVLERILQYRHRSLAYLPSGRRASVHGSLQTTLPLALLRVTTPAHRGLPPVGTVNFLTYIHHSRHTHGFCVRRAEVQNSTVVFQLNFSNNIGFCASISRTNAKPRNSWL